MKNNTLSVVIPAYNEETNIRLGAVDKVIRYLEKQLYDWELIFVNDGSSDKTSQLLKDISKANRKIIVIDNPHQGKAATVISGLLLATKDLVLFTDLDQATPINQLEKLIPYFNQGYDIVIGSRNEHREGAPFLRIIMARGFMYLRSFILGLKNIHDTQCGFKAFRKSIVKKLFTKLFLYRQGKLISGAMVTAGFDIEMLYIAIKLGLKIKEVRVEWHYVETRRVNPFIDSIKGLSDIIQIRINAFKGKYV